MGVGDRSKTGQRREPGRPARAWPLQVLTMALMALTSCSHDTTRFTPMASPPPLPAPGPAEVTPPHRAIPVAPPERSPS